MGPLPVGGTAWGTPTTAIIDLFGGTWVGSTTVIKGSVPWQVNCRASGQPMANRITIEGNCDIAIISVPIAADITYDPATGG